MECDSTLEVKEHFEELVQIDAVDADEIADRYIVWEVVREVTFTVKEAGLTVDFSK